MADEPTSRQAGDKRHLWLGAAQAVIGVALLFSSVVHGVLLLLLSLGLTADGARRAFIAPERTGARRALVALTGLAFSGAAATTAVLLAA